MTHPGERVQVDVKVVPRSCIADPELRLFQYTAIDEFTRLRFLAAYPEQSTYSSADFLRKLTAWYARRGIQVECVQTDNGFEFTNRFSNSKRDLQTLFEKTAAELGIRHKLIRPYTPRHNGKVERSHREDHKRFYSCHDFYSLYDFAKQLAVHHSRSNNLPMRPSIGFPPLSSLSNMFDKPTKFLQSAYFLGLERLHTIRDNSGKQCNPARIAQCLLVGSAPKPLKTRACALWLCRFPASSDLFASPQMQKKKGP